MLAPRTTAGVLALTALCVLGGAASADSLRVVDASVFLPDGGDRVYFAVELNRAPNWPLPLLDVLPAPGEGLELGTLSDGGAVAAGQGEALPIESFQFLLDTNPDADDSTDPFAWEVVVRGGEATEASGIPFRDANVPPIDEDPAAGGWGPTLGVADYALNDNTITFSAPNAWVGIGEAGVSYELMLLSDGATVDTFIPTPTALAAGGVLLIGGLLRRRVRD
ncbi:MAG: hypothetical protein AAF328_05825 [Planctomycetota bacterium]